MSEYFLSTGGKDDKDSGGKDSSDGRASTDKGYLYVQIDNFLAESCD